MLLTLALSGGPWFALQTFAWARMLVAYTQQDGFARGLTKTFDGQHPCTLCKSIQTATAKPTTDKNGAPRIATTETLWAAILNENHLSIPALYTPRFLACDEFAENFDSAPPTPPPRA